MARIESRPSKEAEVGAPFSNAFCRSRAAVTRKSRSSRKHTDCVREKTAVLLICLMTTALLVSPLCVARKRFPATPVAICVMTSKLDKLSVCLAANNAPAALSVDQKEGVNNPEKKRKKKIPGNQSIKGLTGLLESVDVGLAMTPVSGLSNDRHEKIE